jgi:hypothetical protein
MRETRTSGSMSGERKRNAGKSKLPQVTAPLLDSTAYKPYAGKPPVRFCAGGAR